LAGGVCAALSLLDAAGWDEVPAFVPFAAAGAGVFAALRAVWPFAAFCVARVTGAGVLAAFAPAGAPIDCKASAKLLAAVTASPEASVSLSSPVEVLAALVGGADGACGVAGCVAACGAAGGADAPAGAIASLSSLSLSSLLALDGAGCAGVPGAGDCEAASTAAAAVASGVESACAFFFDAFAGAALDASLALAGVGVCVPAAVPPADCCACIRVARTAAGVAFAAESVCADAGAGTGTGAASLTSWVAGGGCPFAAPEALWTAAV
jgi:hypothetical protein